LQKSEAQETQIVG